MVSPRGGDNLYTRIKEVRQKLNLTQAEFAEMIGLSQNYIALIETGKRVPSSRTVSDICRVFGVSLDWLKTGESCMFGCNSQDEIMLAYGELAARKDPNIDGIIQFLRSRTSDEMDVIINTLKDCLSLIEAAKSAKKED